MYVGIFGSLIAARSFGLSQAQRDVLTGDSGARRRRVLFALAMMLLGFLVAIGVAFTRIKHPFVFIGVLAGFTIVMSTVIVRVQKRRAAAAVLEQGEWRMSRALDVLGSWLFGRFERTGWRIRWVRERPTAVADEAGVSAAERRSSASRTLRDGPPVTGLRPARRCASRKIWCASSTGRRATSSRSPRSSLAWARA